MSRTHERAYRLLVDRVRLATPARLGLYAALGALAMTGALWLVPHFGGEMLASTMDARRELALEALALKLHGAAAFAALVGLGAMCATHVRRGWTLRRNRIGGASLLFVLAVLSATGYALYYLVNDETRPTILLLHWALGLGLIPLLMLHIALGRRKWRAQTRKREALSR